MAKREKKPKSEKFDEKEDEQLKQSKFPIVLSSDDEDDEANEDLSLKIVQKAMSRAGSTNRNDAVLGEPKKNAAVFDITSLSSPEVEDVSDLNDKKKKKVKRKKSDKIQTRDEAVDVGKDEEKAKADKAVELDKVVETNPVQISDNTVLRKLLRGPRYFDPPDSGWGTCYNCGEEGHTSANCTSLRWNKPCFVCGSLEHKGKQCTKGQDCFICKKGGHRAKDCPEKYGARSQNYKICLKCGDSGHDLFSCEHGYSPDDLKEIQCYICKRFGHLCCAYTDTGPRQVSCYRCGQLGHSGLGCGMSRGDTTSGFSPSSCYKCGEGGHFARECASSAKGYPTSHGETTSGFSPSSCYKCGGEGHFARECANSAKVHKRSRELSTPTRRFPKENSDFVGVRSVPHDLGKASKGKRSQYEGGFTMPSKSKQRGGWITEDPGDLDLPHRKPKVSRWKSPSTPNNRINKISALNTSGHASSSHSFKKTRKLHFGTPVSNGSANFYQHRFSTPRFGNSSSDGMRRNYDW